MKDLSVESWYGIMVPASTPADVVKKLQDTVVSIANEKSFAAQLADQGAHPLPSSAADATKLMDKEVKRWADIIRHADIRMD